MNPYENFSHLFVSAAMRGRAAAYVTHLGGRRTRAPGVAGRGVGPAGEVGRTDGLLPRVAAHLSHASPKAGGVPERSAAKCPKHVATLLNSLGSR